MGEYRNKDVSWDFPVNNSRNDIYAEAINFYTRITLIFVTPLPRCKTPPHTIRTSIIVLTFKKYAKERAIVAYNAVKVR